LENNEETPLDQTPQIADKVTPYKGKHSLSHDKIFGSKGKNTEDIPEYTAAPKSNTTDIDMENPYLTGRFDRGKDVKELFGMTSELSQAVFNELHTIIPDFEGMIIRAKRKPAANDFAYWYRTLLDRLPEHSPVGIFAELTYYFINENSVNANPMFNYLGFLPFNDRVKLIKYMVQITGLTPIYEQIDLDWADF
jgi:hypothetical protein